MSEDAVESGPSLRIGAVVGERGFIAKAAVFLAAVLFALIVAGMVIAVTGGSPVLAYQALFNGAFGSRYAFSEVLVTMTPLLLAALGVAFAFHGGLFNIGAEGQLTLGGFVAGVVGFELAGLPAFALLPMAVASGGLAGAALGAVPGYLKARFGAHEVITTIMFNFIVAAVTSYTVDAGGPLAASGNVPATPEIAKGAELPILLSGTRLSFGFLLALACIAAVWFLLERTRLGYRIRAVGRNPKAAEYAGINVHRHIVVTMAISGGLAGLAGSLEVLGVLHRFYAAFSPGYGFDAIAIALLGQLNPIGTAAAAFLFGALRAGSIMMEIDQGISRDLISIVSGIVVFFVAANPLVLHVWRRCAAVARGRQTSPATPDSGAKPLPLGAEKGGSE